MAGLSRPFTDADGAFITEKRAMLLSWESIADQMGRSKTAVIEHTRALGLATERPAPIHDASPLHKHRAIIDGRCRSGVSPQDIADEINERDGSTNATDGAVLAAIKHSGFERQALPTGHPITWGAIVAGTDREGCAYQH